MDIIVSRYSNYTDKTGTYVSLREWLKDDSLVNHVLAIRNETNKKKRDTMKSKLPAITPSGLFHPSRCEQNLTNHSRFIQFDIDRINTYQVKEKLSEVENIAYMGLSVSGRGIWGLIPIAYPDKHKQHFAYIHEVIKTHLNIQIDTAPSNVASLRGYSYDPNPYWNLNAIPLKRYLEPQQSPPQSRTSTTIGNPSKELEQAIRKMNIHEPGSMHEKRLRIGRLIGGYIAAGKLDQTTATDTLINSYLDYYSGIDSPQDQLKEIKAINDGIENGMKYPIR